MAEGKEIVVEYSREGEDVHLLSMQSQILPDIRVDYTGIPKDKRGGTATTLLCASALYCYATFLGSNLAQRGATIKSIAGRAVAETGKDDYRRPKVVRIRIEMDVDVEDKDLAALDRCREIMERGCLVTYSVSEGVEIDQVVRRTVK